MFSSELLHCGVWGFRCDQEIYCDNHVRRYGGDGMQGSSHQSARPLPPALAVGSGRVEWMKCMMRRVW